MSMLERVREAISHVPTPSAIDDETLAALTNAVITALKAPTMHMIVHADNHTMFTDERRLKWFEYMLDAALIELPVEA